MKDQKTNLRRLGRVLSIDPRSRRVAHSYFKDGELLDWRMKNFRASSVPNRVQDEIIPYLVQALERFQPHAVLLPQIRPGGSRTRSRDGNLAIEAVMSEALARGIVVHVVSGSSIKKTLTNTDGQPSKNKDDVHRAVVRHFPHLIIVQPRLRGKPWESERYFTPLFNTIAMYLAWQSPSLVEAG